MSISAILYEDAIEITQHCESHRQLPLRRSMTPRWRSDERSTCNYCIAAHATWKAFLKEERTDMCQISPPPPPTDMMGGPENSKNV